MITVLSRNCVREDVASLVLFFLFLPCFDNISRIASFCQQMNPWQKIKKKKKYSLSGWTYMKHLVNASQECSSKEHGGFVAGLFFFFNGWFFSCVFVLAYFAFCAKFFPQRLHH